MEVKSKADKASPYSYSIDGEGSDLGESAQHSECLGVAGAASSKTLATPAALETFAHGPSSSSSERSVSLLMKLLKSTLHAEWDSRAMACEASEMLPPVL